ncbi:non-specific serine,threonine protein kinase [Sarracenia purpurea var. burkii]
MSPQILISLLSILNLSLFLRFSLSSSDPDELLYSSCGGGAKFSCGSISGVDYPFRSAGDPDYCGYPGLVLNCRNNNIPTIDIDNVTYRVLGIDQTAQTMKISREDLMEANCPQELANTTLDNSLFQFVPGYMNLTFLYGCQAPFNLIQGIPPIASCNVSGYNRVYLALGSSVYTGCDANVIVPISGAVTSVNSSDLEQGIRAGFAVQWKVDSSGCSECTGSGGRCGYSSVTHQSSCYCPNPPFVGDTCSPGAPSGSTPDSGAGSRSSNQSSTTPKSIALITAGAIITAVGLGWGIFACTQRRKRSVGKSAAQSAEAKSKETPPLLLSRGLTTTPSTNFYESLPSYPSSKFSDFGKASTCFGVQVFSYNELEEATDTFNPSRELGDGGFGRVYYGKLQDGRKVAVKRLYENNFKRVEQFINEIEILTRLRHENLVTLYGCTSKRSRELLLVYEYIPNGTVADHLHGKRANSGLLSWPIRLNVAVETADALAYLHASDIIHRDVKTTNILLDHNFRVKVADFGLSRLFPTDVTHVSTAPQGTPGYVDPEYYQCYQLTEKSDVYSFGVVLIELISSKMAVDTNRDRHDINLSSMAVNKIQNHALHELVDPCLGFETSGSVRRMITLVAELAFRCLQVEREMRPSMEEVLKALRGIGNEDLSGQKPEVVDIVIEGDDEVGILKGSIPPTSPDSGPPEKWVSDSSTPNSSG